MGREKSTNYTHVELLPAFLWTCPECGIDNFERSIVVELSEEEMHELRDEHGVQPWEEGEFSTAPTCVSCRDCHSRFETSHFRTAEDDGEI